MPSKHKTQALAWVGKLRVGLLLAALGLSSGCSTMTTTDKGVLGGAALGAGAGALIGTATGCPEAGAVIGAGLGGITGGVTGAAIENAERRAEENAHIRLAAQQAAQRGPLGLTEIAQLSQQGVGDAVIIEQIRLTQVVYNLSAEQIVWLKQQGVSDGVIREMQATAYRGAGAPAPVVVYERPRPPVVIYDRWGPPPPPRLGFGFTYVHRGCRRW